ncbi:MAG: ATP-binding protein [Thermoguttaceae bacterium]
MSDIETITTREHELEHEQEQPEQIAAPQCLPPRKHPSDLTLFGNLLTIGSTHENLGGKPEAMFGEMKEHIDFVCERLDITPLQAVLFADLFVTSDGDATKIRELAKLMKCKPIEVCAYFDEFDMLERKGFIDVESNSDSRFHQEGISIKISFDVVCKLQRGERPQNQWAEKLEPHEFLARVAKLIDDQRCSDDDQNSIIIKRFDLMREHNRHLGIVKAIDGYALTSDDQLLLLRFCVNFVLMDNDMLDRDELELVPRWRHMVFDLRRGQHPLQKKNLIEHANSDGLAQKDCYALTEKAKDELLDDVESLMNPKSITGLIEASSLKEKPLFYPDKTQRSVKELSDLLREDNWQNVRANLTKNGMRTGFACLFSGGPGTGKTETAMQVARMTGRGIIQVDIAESKSCWHGESEKRIKAIFTRYRAAVKRSALTPILLFNEADALINKRLDLERGLNGAVNKTENAIQNIILQEMENLDGILIATTNLTCNMDKAFERRFLYKIEFEKPTLDARKSIWLAMIPELSEADVNALASTFDFSGGQIENISRRRAVALVLHGQPPSLDDLIAYSKEEQSGSEHARRIGFAV